MVSDILLPKIIKIC